jgi:predicted NUDIX family phosphoesterase
VDDAASEKILVVRRADLLDLLGEEDPWHGVRAGKVVEAVLELVSARGFYRPRPEAEADPSTKQVIPYLVLFDRGRVFLMQRTRAGADARLHDHWTIGLGGHVAPADRDLHGGLQREWAEEVVADWGPEAVLLGLLNDDSTPVGRVHLGVVFSAEADGRAVRIRETDKLRGAFAERSEVRRVYEHLETWSRLLFDHLVEGGRIR